MNLLARVEDTSSSYDYEGDQYVGDTFWQHTVETLTAPSKSEIFFVRGRVQKGFLPAKRYFGKVADPAPIQDQVTRKWEDALREIEALEVGAPSSERVKCLSDFSSQLPREFDFPEIEHDEDDGSLVLRWHSIENGRTFSVSFVSGQEIVATLMPPSPNGDSLWRYKVVEERKISDLFSNDQIREVAAKS